MQIGDSLRRNGTAAVVVAVLCWLVMAVSSLGDDTQRGLSFLLRQPPSVALVTSGETVADSTSHRFPDPNEAAPLARQ
jgi:hypothetical protein